VASGGCHRGRVDAAAVGHARCPFCHAPVRPGADEPKRSCGACMAWHHAECWAEHGGCAACGGRAQPVAGPGVGRPDRRFVGAALVATGAVLLIALAIGFRLGAASRAGPADASPAAASSPYPGETEAVAALRRDALAGDVDAMFDLAVCLEEGDGVDADLDAAVAWYLAAAKEGDTEAMVILAELTGERRWLRRAARAGDPHARERVAPERSGGSSGGAPLGAPEPWPDATPEAPSERRSGRARAERRDELADDLLAEIDQQIEFWEHYGRDR